MVPVITCAKNPNVRMMPNVRTNLGGVLVGSARAATVWPMANANVTMSAIKPAGSAEQAPAGASSAGLDDEEVGRRERRCSDAGG